MITSRHCNRRRIQTFDWSFTLVDFFFFMSGSFFSTFAIDALQYLSEQEMR